MRYEYLKKKYPKFIYEKYSYRISKNPRTRTSSVRGKNLEIFFDFKIEPGICFRPKIIIENVNQAQIKRIGDTKLNNLVFHLGLMEIPSYWKATCSPEILIKAGPLNSEQIKWWKNLIFKGMAQFFYENKIDFRKPNFLKIKSLHRSDLCKFVNNTTNKARTLLATLKNRVLVPIGGGKDSIVTLEKLKKQKKKIGCFLMNPTKAMREIVRVARIKNSIIVKREIDPTLLELNKRGFLNGHTPITAVISFLSVLAAVLFNYKYIAFSNEKSADEGNVRYFGKIINHQWSKSSEFEKKLKKYLNKYLTLQVEYFSYLRKYTELEITKMFTKYQKYFPVFSSCNVVLAKKLKKRWCSNCPKCLFVYVTLYPFLEKEQLLKIFGKDIFQNRKLLPVMKGLLEQEKPKPFECVGTKKESQMAFRLSLKKAKKEGKMPWLLAKIRKSE